MNWYVVDKDFVNYLHLIDNKVENIEYSGRIKPYIGIVLQINEFKYYVPISSKKEKYCNMKNSIDLYKIENSDRILGVLNLNNMIPIENQHIKKLDYKNIEEYRKFKNELEKNKYIRLLSKELKIINNNQDRITSNANKLYNYVINNPKSSVAKRCCDFKLLEREIIKYNKEEKC